MTDENIFSVYDKDGHLLTPGDKVRLLDMTGTVTVEAGALGLAFETRIDWDKLETTMKAITYSNNQFMACFNDNFISFWELIWNFNAEDNMIPFVELLNKPEERP